MAGCCEEEQAGASVLPLLMPHGVAWRLCLHSGALCCSGSSLELATA